MADNVWGRFNVTSIIEVLTQEGNLSREKFGSLMASYLDLVIVEIMTSLVLSKVTHPVEI